MICRPIGSPADVVPHGTLIPGVPSTSNIRVVNLADFVPQLTGLTTDDTSYVHVGQQWWFASYSQYLWQNHELALSYLSAVTSYPDIITEGPPPFVPALITPVTTTTRRFSAAEKEAATVR